MPGNNLIMAATLSRAPDPGVVDQERLQEDIETYVDATFEIIPATERRLEEIRQHHSEHA